MLALMSALGSLAIHMVVPALPDIAHQLAVPPTTAQLTISMYLLGLSAGQLLAGPVSDTFGRRTILLIGICLFVTGSTAAGLAQSSSLLLAARIVQAFGGAFGIVSARAIISDMSSAEEASGRLATLTSIALLSPLLAPTLGGLLIEAGGWRIIFALLSAAGACAGAFAVLRLRESLPPPARLVSIAAIFPAYRRLLASGRFRRFAMTNAAASAAMFIFLSGSSFLLISRWGLKPGQSGLFYFAITAMGLLGTLSVRRLERGRGALRTGLTVMLSGASVMLALALSGYDGPLALLLPMMVVFGGSGMAAPASIAGAMHAEAGIAGTATSLAGAVQMAVSALAASAVSFVAPGSFVGMSAAILAMTLAAFLCAPARSA